MFCETSIRLPSSLCRLTFPFTVVRGCWSTTTASAYPFVDLPLNGRCRQQGIKPQSYRVEKEFTESAQDYMSRANLSVKVLDFVQLGGAYPTLYLSGFPTLFCDAPFSLTTYRA